MDLLLILQSKINTEIKHISVHGKKRFLFFPHCTIFTKQQSDVIWGKKKGGEPGIDKGQKEKNLSYESEKPKSDHFSLSTILLPFVLHILLSYCNTENIDPPGPVPPVATPRTTIHLVLFHLTVCTTPRQSGNGGEGQNIH